MTTQELLGKYKLVLGLEIHLHIDTKTKMFCFCSSDIYDKSPNTHTCPVCLGLPGALPVPNYEAVRKTQLLGLAFNCKLNQNSRFDRKHYFYPDLPKGYQISQYKEPLCLGGNIVLENGFTAQLERIHLEEDTAKSVHEGGKTLLDYNMSSMPLIEIVSKPCFRTVEDAVEYCKQVQKTVRELQLGDVDMEKGQMRLEPNISLRTVEMEKSDILPNYKVEIKNINSFRFMEKAVFAEIKRQKELLDQNIMPVQENRGFIEEKNATVSQRKKEEAHDYRYFPEPDIPPMVFDDKYINEIKAEFELLRKASPASQKAEILREVDIDEKLKARILSQMEVDHLKVIKTLIDRGLDASMLANLFLNKKEIRELSADDIEARIKAESVKVSDSGIIESAVSKVLSENQEAVESYKKGKENALQFLVGMVMKDTKGKVDAKITREEILKKIK